MIAANLDALPEIQSYAAKHRNLTINHIIPTSKGRQDVGENKQFLCQSCNSVKGNRLTTAELKAKLLKLGIITKT